MEKFLLFALGSSKGYGERITESLGEPLAPHEERSFEDGEHKARPLTNVRDHDVYVVGSLHASPGETVNDKLCRLLFFAGAVRDSGARRVTAVTPYLCYARKDRKTKERDPTTTRYVAQLMESVGIDRVVTMDVHNLAAYQNAFRRPCDHLEAAPLLADAVLSLLGPDEDLAVCSPDAGGFKRAEAFRRRLEGRTGRAVEMAMMEKRRSRGVVTGTTLFGEVDGRTVVVVDDLIATGTTLLRASEACRAKGARAVLAAATHGAFTGNTAEVVANPALDRIIVTDTISPLHLPAELVSAKVTVIDTAPLLAEAIGHLHAGGPIEDLTAH